ncbi:hypothetical protein [Ideonella sp. YS5]|uniref:hypothetical protein n=1 Tax=Ideonella sp. YS5 TaxID=3453714 RepID=UPI003EF01261
MSSPKKLAIASLSATALVASIGFAYAQSSDDTALANSNYNGAQNSAENNVNGAPAMPPSAVTAYDAETGAASAMADQSTTTTTTTTTSTDYSSSPASSSMAATDTANSSSSATSPWSADSTQGSSTATTATDPNAARPNAANPTAGTSPDKTDITHPAVAPQGDTSGTNPSMTTNSTSTSTSSSTAPMAAPAAAPTPAPVQTESRVDLNSPNEPQYNLASDPWLRHRNAHNSNSTNGAAADNNTSGTASSGERAPRADRN